MTPVTGVPRIAVKASSVSRCPGDHNPSPMAFIPLLRVSAPGPTFKHLLKELELLLSFCKEAPNELRILRACIGLEAPPNFLAQVCPRVIGGQLAHHAQGITEHLASIRAEDEPFEL
eukprot:CAMPEP_0206048908 /NCGR_PEP_ID=MMETSP1466-20131121/25412_1 /ASSEMBLY_ACC=CAM_ASM_001126 /TAXON_ID=44452 /ORGANISM="Pavlova gyrans, Strain CCMP608" /LENGTH=116 /DNA_ID=CAMNT_0053423985 /DNA_START=56 /DNA_END=402 /DNA_ORIENTATION=-